MRTIAVLPAVRRSISMLASLGEEEAGWAVDQDGRAVFLGGGPGGEEVQDLAGVALAVREVGPVRAPDEPVGAGGDQSLPPGGHSAHRLVLRDPVRAGQLDPAAPLG